LLDKKSLILHSQTILNYLAMNEFLKNLGSILVLVGVALLTLYYFGVIQYNATLAAAAIIMITGSIAHVVINKHIN
jgi:hypothetical protein